MKSSKKTMTPLLRLRVIDIPTEKESTLSIWRPNDELVQGLKEGSVVKVYSVNVCSKLALKSTKQTRFERIQYDSIKDLVRFERGVQVIEDILDDDFKPYFDEVDIVGVVVHIGQLNQDFQAAFLCDSMYNFVSLQFHHGITKHALESMIKVGNVLNLSNLQWRKSSAEGRLFKGSEVTVPCLYVTEVTLVSTDSKIPERSSMMKELAKEVSNTDGFMKEANLRLGQLMKKKPRVLVSVHYHKKKKP